MKGGKNNFSRRCCNLQIDEQSVLKEIYEIVGCSHPACFPSLMPRKARVFFLSLRSGSHITTAQERTLHFVELHIQRYLHILENTPYRPLPGGITSVSATWGRYKKKWKTKIKKDEKEKFNKNRKKMVHICKKGENKGLNEVYPY
jgi:hypothetical protein